ncbi:MAG: PAS domain-containing protein [Flavobacterium sp.]|nr:PAS domain-containing protein [Flavobacterium sp.]
MFYSRKNINSVIICNKVGTIEWVNDSFVEMSGYTKEELLGKKPGNLLQGPKTNKETIAYLANQIKNGLPFNCEIINYNKKANNIGFEFKDKHFIIKMGKCLNTLQLKRILPQRKNLISN